jgi:hypothetical protein
MDTKKLFEILNDTTVQLRKGHKVIGKAIGNVRVIEFFAMPHESEADGSEGIEKVDCHFLIIGVYKKKALERKDELLTVLKGWDEKPALSSGPSYIHVGAAIGSQDAAFQLFALGKVLGLWSLITPESIGITGESADVMAGKGFVMIDGFRPSSEG